MSKTTPCEFLGYTEGMKFIVCHSRNSEVDAGDFVWLHDDDGTTQPEFRTTEDEDHDGCELEYIALSDVAPYIEGKTPVQSRNYKVGDIFILNEDDDDGWEEGDEVKLIHDDGSTCPKFEKSNYDGTTDTTWLYLGQLRHLKSEIGRRARVISNITGGHPKGTEGVIITIDEDDPNADLEIKTSSGSMWHATNSCVVYSHDGEEKPYTHSEKTEWQTKPANEWKEGDKGIVRGQQEDDPHHFQIGEEITFVRSRDSERGIFRGTKHTSTQNIEYSLIEVISASKSSPVEEVTPIEDETSQKTYKYFIDGDSIEVSLIGYFDGEPICAYKDRWGDIQTFVAKQSLLVSDDD